MRTSTVLATFHRIPFDLVPPFRRFACLHGSRWPAIVLNVAPPLITSPSKPYSIGAAPKDRPLRVVVYIEIWNICRICRLCGVKTNSKVMHKMSQTSSRSTPKRCEKLNQENERSAWNFSVASAEDLTMHQIDLRGTCRARPAVSSHRANTTMLSEKIVRTESWRQVPFYAWSKLHLAETLCFEHCKARYASQTKKHFCLRTKSLSSPTAYHAERFCQSQDTIQFCLCESKSLRSNQK